MDLQKKLQVSFKSNDFSLIFNRLQSIKLSDNAIGPKSVCIPCKRQRSAALRPPKKGRTACSFQPSEPESVQFLFRYRNTFVVFPTWSECLSEALYIRKGSESHAFRRFPPFTGPGPGYSGAVQPERQRLHPDPAVAVSGHCQRQHLPAAAHPAGPRLPDPGRPGSSLPHRPHGVPHWKHLSGRSQRLAGDLPPDARHRVGLPRDMPPRQPEKRGCLLPQKGGDPAAQPYRHGGGPQPAGLRHRRGQGSAGRLPVAPAQGPVLRRPVPADRAHHHRLPPPGRPAGRDPGQRLCLRV